MTKTKDFVTITISMLKKNMVGEAIVLLEDVLEKLGQGTVEEKNYIVKRDPDKEVTEHKAIKLELAPVPPKENLTKVVKKFFINHDNDLFRPRDVANKLSIHDTDKRNRIATICNNLAKSNFLEWEEGHYCLYKEESLIVTKREM